MFLVVGLSNGTLKTLWVSMIRALKANLEPKYVEFRLRDVMG
jgi:hypothetical protein